MWFQRLSRVDGRDIARSASRGTEREAPSNRYEHGTNKKQTVPTIAPTTRTLMYHVRWARTSPSPTPWRWRTRRGTSTKSPAQMCLARTRAPIHGIVQHADAIEYGYGPGTERSGREPRIPVSQVLLSPCSADDQRRRDDCAVFEPTGCHDGPPHRYQASPCHQSPWGYR